MKLLFSVILFLCLAAIPTGFAASPKLILHLSVDQFRPDYLTRFQPFFSPAFSTNGGVVTFGGFEFLKHQGAWFADARHAHYPLFTGPGHAVQLTGAHPYKSGIVGNYWYDLHEKNGRRYCVEDLSPRGEIIGTNGRLKKDPGISPAPLAVSTVGDELRIATANRAKVWGLALKDRAAVLLAGHFANGALWYDEDSGDWVSSRYYCANGELPGWVLSLNRPQREAGRLIDSYTNLVWKGSVPSGANVWTGPAAFDHSFTNKPYKDLTFSPFGNDFVFKTARLLIENEQLGADEIPDLLALNFSSNDYVGHTYGADSAETLDITVQFDKQLGAFFTWLNERIGITNTLVILTSDHGAAPYPKQMHEESHFDAAIADDRAIEAKLNEALQQRYSFRPGKTNAVKLVEYNVYIFTECLDTGRSAAEIHLDLAEAITKTKSFGFSTAYTREQILEGRMPRTDIADRVSKGFSPENSGDIVLVPRSYWVHLDINKYKYKTSHGSPYAYDTAAPLLMAGAGLTPGLYYQPVTTLDIAPTLSWLLGILPPSGSEGKILPAVR